MAKPIVLCTLAMDPAGVALLEPLADVVVAADPGAATLYELIGDADILLVRTLLPSDLFEHPNRLLGVVRNGTGLDFIPVASATEHGIAVANVPGANARAVVEYCIGSFLALARRSTALDVTLRAKGWNTARALSGDATELAGKTVGIVGVGTIGAALAQVCRDGFGMRVIASAPRPASLPDFVEPVSLETLFGGSDFISLNCPLNEATRHLVDAQRLRAMKPGAVLVNASRGPVVDEAALAVALREGWIRGAALDVYDAEPLPSDHPLLSVPNLLLSPHTAALTRESNEKMSVGAARQIVQLLSGQRPSFLVNPEVWARHESRRQSLGSQSLGSQALDPQSRRAAGHPGDSR